MSRLIALIVIVIPGAIAAIGVKLMRDTLFDYLNAPFPWLWLQFISGLAAFLIGIAFIGGWIFYRDRKRNYVADKYRKSR
ncbi:uncharacterized protein DUF2627 [Scopulibacillus darangshiensis]|uniref:Uncharacterized protein DUF2627 n=1 Tax=Scopulibacillus darangshiensis TaxID=442528 RepID=A0A4R2P9U5_9BACL|nr:DUF2627 domain-containing protein [Scopulibacillus darangshiensis]TCP31819.1 uncharacterized protein DUF2627 [Scopulibacillus darangshiensis]